MIREFMNPPPLRFACMFSFCSSQTVGSIALLSLQIFSSQLALQYSWWADCSCWQLTAHCGQPPLTVTLHWCATSCPSSQSMCAPLGFMFLICCRYVKSVLKKSLQSAWPTCCRYVKAVSQSPFRVPDPPVAGVWSQCHKVHSECLAHQCWCLTTACCRCVQSGVRGLFGVPTYCTLGVQQPPAGSLDETKITRIPCAPGFCMLKIFWQ